MKACIVRPHHAGLFSLINNVVTCLSLYDYVHVDWREGCIYGNAWPHLFVMNANPSDHPQSFDSIEVVSNYPHQMLTYRNAGLLYQSERLLDWRQAVHEHWRKLMLLPHIVRRAEDFIEEHLGDEYAAVLIRSNTHAGEQLTGQAQTADQYREALRRCHGMPIYAAASDTESLQWLSDFFVVTHPDTRRGNSRDVQLHLDETQTVEDAVQCMVEVLIMSKASVFVHPVSNMATAALYMNPELRSVYLA